MSWHWSSHWQQTCTPFCGLPWALSDISIVRRLAAGMVTAPWGCTHWSEAFNLLKPPLLSHPLVLIHSHTTIIMICNLIEMFTGCLWSDVVVLELSPPCLFTVLYLSSALGVWHELIVPSRFVIFEMFTGCLWSDVVVLELPPPCLFTILYLSSALGVWHKLIISCTTGCAELLVLSIMIFSPLKGELLK